MVQPNHQWAQGRGVRVFGGLTFDRGDGASGAPSLYSFFGLGEGLPGGREGGVQVGRPDDLEEFVLHPQAAGLVGPTLPGPATTEGEEPTGEAPRGIPGVFCLVTAGLGRCGAHLVIMATFSILNVTRAVGGGQ